MASFEIEKIKKSLSNSSANYRVNLGCLFLFFTTMVLLPKFFPSMGSIQLMLLCLLTTVIPLWLYDLFIAQIYRRPSTDLLTKPTQFNKERLVIKLIGFYTTIFVILCFYYLIDTVFPDTVLKTFLKFLNPAAPWMIVLSLIYFYAIDRRQKNPCDEYWQMGCLITGRWRNIDTQVLKEHTRAWFIKAFFTPFLFVLLLRYLEHFRSFHEQGWNFLFFHGYLLDLFYTADVIYGLLGYVLTCRVLDTHIRSTEPTFLGWFVCLMCYDPLNTYFGIGLFQYDDGLQWQHWFAFFPIFYYFYAIVILFLTLVYGLSTVAFGYRMSNLTYRGLITSGPYRFTKHPAYVCKVASWWLISLPFLSVSGPGVALQNTLSLLFISFIYYLRARTEENHLSNYPEYVEYGNWMNDHGVFRSIGKFLPFLKYSEEKCKRWRSIVWFKKSGIKTVHS